MWVYRLNDFAAIAQLVEHFLGKEEVMGSCPIGGSMIKVWLQEYFL